MSTQNQIHMNELKAAWDQLSSDELILDVRSHEEYAEGHVPGSLNIPHDQIQAHLKDLAKYKKIYVYCRSGGRALQATEALMRSGSSSRIICITRSGMPEWMASGFSFAK